MALKSFSAFTDIVEDITKANAFDYQNQFTARMGGLIAKRTPIDTGLAKGNWQAGVNPKPTPTNELDKTKTGIRAQRKMYKSLDIGKFKSGRSVYIKNGVDSLFSPKTKSFSFGIAGESQSVVGPADEETGGYIIQLEEGKSRQAPSGMVYISIAQSSRISKQALKAVVTKP